MNYRKSFLIIIALFMAFSCGARATEKSVLFGDLVWKIPVDSILDYPFPQNRVSGFNVSNGFVIVGIDSGGVKNKIKIFSSKTGEYLHSVNIGYLGMSNDYYVTKRYIEINSFRYSN